MLVDKAQRIMERPLLSVRLRSRGPIITQANSLREMADRRQLEADLLAREVGPDDPTVEKKRRLAEELRAASVEADNKAHDASRQVPHGMVQ